MRHFEDHGDARLIVFSLEAICLAFGFFIWLGHIIVYSGLARGLACARTSGYPPPPPAALDATSPVGTLRAPGEIRGDI